MTKKTLFGSARIDERGKITGGIVGDQTEKEVSTQSAYMHSKGWRVFRPRRKADAKRLAYAMAAACGNNSIGYDQSNRLSLYNDIKTKRFDPYKAVFCECDCSALVRVCLAYAGYQTPDFNTESEPRVLASLGAFDEVLNIRTPIDFRAGDILVTKTKGHTGIIVRDETITLKRLRNQVINGFWGDGNARRDALRACGYDYEKVQKAVNAYYIEGNAHGDIYVD